MQDITISIGADTSAADRSYQESQKKAESAAATVGQKILEVYEKTTRGGNAALSALSASILAVATASGHAFAAAGSAVGHFTAFVLKTAEAAAAAAGAFALAGGEIGKYAATASSASSVTETLVAVGQNAFRAYELVATGFAASTFALIGFGIVVEAVISKVARLTNARAELIEQESLLAAKSGLAVEGVPVSAATAFAQIQRLDTASRISGANGGTIHDLQEALSSQFQTNSAGTKSALSTLGISGYYNGLPSADTLQKIAEGFANIKDPADRASAAIALFGKDKAADAIEQLNSRFAAGIQATKDWALELDGPTKNKVFAFRQALGSIGDVFNPLVDFFHAFGEKIEQGLVKASANIYDFVARNARAFDELTSHIPGAQAFRQYGSGPTDQEFHDNALRDLKYGDGKNPGVIDTRDALLARTQAGNARALISEVESIQARKDQSLDGVKASLSAVEHQRDEALAALKSDSAFRSLEKGQRGGKTYTEHTIPANPNELFGHPITVKTEVKSRALTDDQRVAFAAQYTTANAFAAELKAKIDAKDASEKLGISIQRKQSDLSLRADDLARSVILHPSEGANAFAGLRAQAEAGGVRYLGRVIDDQGDVHEFAVRAETVRKLLQSNQAYAKSLNDETTKQQIKSEQEDAQRRLAFDNDIFLKRQQYIIQTGELELATIDKAHAHENTLAGYTRDERLQTLQLQNPQTLSGRLSGVGQRLGIEKDYLTDTAVNDAATIERLKARQITANDAAYALGEINEQTRSDRSRAIQEAAAESGKELNDKFNHDILAANRNAAIESTKIVRDAQLAQFDSLKSSALGVLNSIETRSKGVFASIGDALKASFLTAFNEIVSSQIAASLFRLINPSSTVSFDKSGGSLLGALGLGTKPVFGGGKLDLPNHVGDVQLINGALPVTITNLPQQSQVSRGGSLTGAFPGGFGSLARLGVTAASALGLSQLVSPAPAAIGAGGTGVSESISFGGASTDLGGAVYPGGGGSFISGGESLGIPSGYGFPSPAGIGGRGGGIGQALGLGGLFKGGTKGLLESLNQFVGGAFHPGNTVGLAGNLSQLGHSPAALLGGGLLLSDGLKRGGAAGALEDIGGGALVGFKFGGPIGAAIGAAAGGIAGLLRGTVFKGAAADIKAEVKRIYKIDISNGIAEQINQIGKQSFGGDWGTALRSAQVQELLSLYADSTGQKFPIQVKPHEFEGAITNGELRQVPTSLNGQVVGFNSTLPTIAGSTITRQLPIGYGAGGTGTETNSTGGDINVNLNLDGQVLATHTIRTIDQNPRSVSSANNRSLSQNAGRLPNQGAILSPTTVFG